MDILPSAAPRKPVHTRKVVFNGYSRADGLWDIEAEIQDAKAYSLRTRDGVAIAAGEPVHHMKIRLTLDDDFVIRDIVSGISSAPFPECQKTNDPMRSFIGLTVGRGWRANIEQRLGGIKGCTHLRELLFNMATAAFQTIPHYLETVRSPREPQPGDAPPHHMNGCMSWDLDGPVVARVAPEFAGWRPLVKHPPAS